MPIVLGQFFEAPHQKFALFQVVQIRVATVEFARCRSGQAHLDYEVKTWRR